MRPAEYSDLPAIKAALVKLIGMAQGRGQMAYADLDAAMNNIIDRIGSGHGARVIDGFLILYDVGKPWYMDVPVLIEDMILRIEKTGSPVSVAIQALDILAQENGCPAIAAGDTQVGYMTPHYINHGYTVIGTQLLKGVPDGVCSQEDRRAGPD